MSWTYERVELLKKLWTDGLSASQIANEMGGVSRNAVIGKVHRLGLPARAKSTRSASPKPRKPRPQSAPQRGTSPQFRGNAALKADIAPDAEAAPRPEPLRVVAEELHIPVEDRASILELNEYRCRWPVGDPMKSDFYFCGMKCSPDKPYCDYHSAIAYQPSTGRRRTAKSA